jgi:hypothetical protein
MAATSGGTSGPGRMTRTRVLRQSRGAASIEPGSMLGAECAPMPIQVHLRAGIGVPSGFRVISQAYAQPPYLLGAPPPRPDEYCSGSYPTPTASCCMPIRPANRSPRLLSRQPPGQPRATTDRAVAADRPCTSNHMHPRLVRSGPASSLQLAWACPPIHLPLPCTVRIRSVP